MQPEPKFQNGDVVKDQVTSYEGMIVATVLWLNGCYRYVLQAEGLKKDGEPLDRVEVDELQLTLVKAGKFKGNHDTGGPRPSVSSKW